MLFVALIKFKVKKTKAVVAEDIKRIEADAKKGIKWMGIYWTLGRYDAVAVFEASDEKAAMKMSINRADGFNIETLVAVPVEEARKLVE